MYLLILVGILMFGRCVYSADDIVSTNDVLVVTEHGLGHKLLFYIPNRFLDIMDIFRARLRIGHGVSCSFSFTQRGSFFAGKYNTVYVGLPGPRGQSKFISPVGREKQKGIIMMGVDATDDTDYPSCHAPAEIQIGAQALIIGADVGVDVWEFGDFLAGLVLIDLRKDDL